VWFALSIMLQASVVGASSLPASEPASSPASAPASAPVDEDIGEATPVAPTPQNDMSPSRTPLRVAVSSSLVGRFASTKCEEPVAEAPFQRMSASFGSTEVKKGMTDILRLDAGDLLGTATIGRFAVDEDVDALASAISALGLRALSLGHRDLSAARERVVKLARALKRVDLSYSLSNLRCDRPDHPLCAEVIDADDPPLVIETGSGKVGFVSAVSPSVLAHLPSDRTEGIALLPPAQALIDATSRARARGAVWVVAVYDPSVQSALEDALDATLGTTTSLDLFSTPDLILVPGISRRVRMVSGATAPTPIVATRPAEAVTVSLYDGSDPVIRIAEKAEPAVVISRYAENLNRKLCADADAFVPRPMLSRALGREDFAAFVLDVLREQHYADVGVLNERAINPRASYPVEGALSPIELLDVMPFEQEVRLVKLNGGQLKAFLDAPSHKEYFIRGAAMVKGAWRINGRPLEVNQEYRVAATDYVVDSTPAGFEDASSTPKGALREAMLSWLAKTKSGDEIRMPIDPAERTRWRVFGRLQVDLNNVSVVNPNPAVFTDAQLSRGRSLSFVGEAELRAIGSHPAYALENQVRLRYGLVNAVGPDGTTSGAVNNVDLITARTLWFYRRLFSRVPRWFEPRPYADLLVETEFTKPETRSYHHLLLLPTSGIRFELTPPFSLYVGGGFTWEVFAQRGDLVPASDPAAAVVVAGWQLLPTRLLTLPQGTVDAETNLDCFVRDIGGNTQAQARLRLRLVIPIFSVLALTATHDVYVRYVRTQDAMTGVSIAQVGFSGDLIIGLQVTLTTTRQAFLW
jgi:5'-nucleotidase, C-terminal domain